MKYKFQWFFDVQTTNSMQIINVKAGGALAQARTLPLWSVYKYYKLGKISVKMVPSVTIPMDPLGLSYDVDDPNSVDPRDMVSPGLIRITNGEDFDDRIVDCTPEVQRQIYNNMLLDRRWFKWNLQSGVSRTARPLLWEVAQLHQDMYPGSSINYPIAQAGLERTLQDTGSHSGSFTPAIVDANNSPPANGTVNGGFSDPYGLFQTGHYKTMNWMPTDALQRVANRDTTPGAPQYLFEPSMAPCLESTVMKIITPPQYKTSWFFRVYVTEEILFTGMRSWNQSGVRVNSSGDLTALGFQSPDQFIYPQAPVAGAPHAVQGYTQRFSLFGPNTPNDGGGEKYD